MAGTRTAPTINGTPVYQELQLSWIDYTGDVRSDSYFLDAAATDAQAVALAAAAQAASNSSLWRATMKSVYEGDQDSSNGTEVVWENVEDNLVIQAKNTTKQSLRFFIPAPNNGMFVEGTENIDPTNAELTAVLTAFLAVVPTGYTIRGARFTHRRQINQQIKF